MTIKTVCLRRLDALVATSAKPAAVARRAELAATGCDGSVWETVPTGYEVSTYGETQHGFPFEHETKSFADYESALTYARKACRQHGATASNF